MKFPSPGHLATSFWRSAQRFYGVLLVALIKAGLLIGLAETDYNDKPVRALLEKWAMTVSLAIPLVIVIHLVSERRKWKWVVNLGLFLALAVLLALFFFSMPGETGLRDYLRFAMFFVAGHLLVSFIPFAGFDEPNGFWQFNKNLFLQFLSATLYAVTLYIGLLIAIETVKYLFDIDYGFKIELDLFLLIANFFHTVFFLSGVPARLESMDQEVTYPKGLKLFTQFVLLPLEVIYLVILYVYTGKILVNWQLPEGGVAYLVLAFSIAGIFALLLLYPLREVAGERWIKLFSKRFHIALLPLTVLLFVGIFRRIHDYGITENRYIVAVLAFWLVFITIYFLISKKDDIRWIPLSLCVISVVLAVGPWSVFEVAKRDQRERFEAILMKYKLISEKGVIKGKSEVTAKDYESLISIINFFSNRNQVKVLEPYFENLRKVNNNYSAQSEMISRINQVITLETDARLHDVFLSYSFGNEPAKLAELDSKGFDYITFLDAINGKCQLERSAVTVELLEGGKKVRISKKGSEIVVWDIEKRILELEKEYGTLSNKVAPSRMTFDFENDQVAFRMVVRNLSQSNNAIILGPVLLMSKK